MKIYSAIVLLIYAAACNSGADGKKDLSRLNKPEKMESVNGVATADSVFQPGQYKQEESKQKVPAAPPQVDWDKKIIKTATLQLEVQDYKGYTDQMKATIKSVGAYIAQEEQNQSDYKIEDIVTIKVPVDQFDNALSALSAGKEKIWERKITSEDVTGEVIDTKSRLEARRQVRLRYLEFLKQAKNMEEVLQVQEEINSIQEEIESAAGRINYLNHAASYSTIQLTFFHVLNNGARQPDHPTFGQQLLNALNQGAEWLEGLAIFMATLWPLWLLAIFVWFLLRRIRPARAKAN